MSLAARFRKGLHRTAENWTLKFNAISTFETNGEPESESIDHDTLGALEELLVEADVGVAAAASIVTRIRDEKEESQRGLRLRSRVKAEVLRILSGSNEHREQTGTPRVVLVVGVNGTGKTTTVGKLAHRWSTEGRTLLICAADTFRAAGTEQIMAWAVRASVDIVRAKPGTDPTAVVFDALQAGRARKRDVLLIDTAGRLHTRTDLMGELAKIKRVVAREVAGAPHEVLLVVDATVGQNGLSQARRFLDVVGVTGIVLTKLDGTAKGGIAVGIASELGVPIRYVGVGEGIDDLLRFSPDAFVDALFCREIN